MSDFNTKKCDCCGKLKQEANHWLVVIRSRVGCCVVPSGIGLVAEIAAPLSPTTKASVEAPELLDACGDDCSTKMLSEWLQRLAGSAE